MSIYDEIYYEQNPEAIEQDWRDFLRLNNLSEDDLSLMEYIKEL